MNLTSEICVQYYVSSLDCKFNFVMLSLKFMQKGALYIIREKMEMNLIC